jgi:hypothetical protein
MTKMPSNDPMIVCPKCATKIRLTDSLTQPILSAAREEYEIKLADQQRLFQDRETRLADQEEEINRRQVALDGEIRNRLNSERAQVAQEEAQKAEVAFNDRLQSGNEEIAELRKILAERDQKLVEARKVQAEMRRKERQLEETRLEMECTVESRINGALAEIRANALKEAEDKLKLRIIEREETIMGMKRQIEDLKRRAEQGSEQLQGEAQEIEMEKLLRAKFPGDIIKRIPKGTSGGDILQSVLGPHGQSWGTILLESKRTKKWSQSWLRKLRNDQRASSAHAAILVSEAVPKGLESFDLIDGVWVAEFRCAIAVVTAVRQALIEVWAARKTEECEQTKAEMVYRYLTGQRFNQRVVAIVEWFTAMQDDLNRERTVMMRLWSKREQQIMGIVQASSGIYGDLQGIAGHSLPEIAGLDFKAPSEQMRLPA